MKNYSLKIGWLYPELMSTYGDRGNVIVLQKRCEWRGIGVDILRITPETKLEELRKVDLIFGGGAQDLEQEIVMRDIKKHKGNVVKELIENDVPALFVCGSPQLMGNYYEPAEGKKIEGLGIFDMITKHPDENKSRLIGNIVAEVYWENLQKYESESDKLTKKSPQPPFSKGEEELWDNNKVIVGFENHGGRTYLGKNAKPFARVIKGFGNNGEDGTEGVVYKNAIGSYLHGPLLPKNPLIADYLISKALEVKYGEKVDLQTLDDELETKARDAILKRLKVD